MAYWLSNTSALLYLLQRSLKAAGASGATPHRKPPPPTSFLGRMTMVWNTSTFSSYFMWGGNVMLFKDPVLITLLMRCNMICFVFLGISLFSFFCKSCCTSIWYSTPSWCQISCSAFQAATHSLCGENLRNYSRQLEKRPGIITFLVYSGSAVPSLMTSSLL